jgi:cytochrome c biogenesis protein CcmG/thiol:disulfide interchange protein DsbE
MLLAVNSFALDFTLRDLDNKEVKLSDYEGKVVLVNFWATWCPPCRAEIPHFVEMVDEMGDKGLVVLGISLDRGGVPVVEKWLKDNPVNYTMVMGEDPVTQEFQALLSQSDRGAIPFSFIINKSGEVKHKIVGYRDKAEWVTMINPLLAE